MPTDSYRPAFHKVCLQPVRHDVYSNREGPKGRSAPRGKALDFTAGVPQEEGGRCYERDCPRPYNILAQMKRLTDFGSQ